jgi:hypothetical protein
VSLQDHDVIFEFSGGTRAEKFGAIRTEQDYTVRPVLLPIGNSQVSESFYEEPQMATGYSQ